MYNKAYISKVGGPSLLNYFLSSQSPKSSHKQVLTSRADSSLFIAKSQAPITFLILVRAPMPEGDLDRGK